MSDDIKETTEEFDDRAALSAIRRFRIIDVNMVRLFFAVLFAGAVIALIPMLREDYSDAEHRKLAEFPKFSFSSLFSGEYFDGINLWFSDTFPFRDKLITLNGYINNCFGGSNVQIHGDIEQGDDIPDVPSEPPVTSDENSSESQVSSQEESSSSVSSAPPAPIVEQVGALLMVDDTGYEYYNFRQNLADMYAAAISRAADSLAGKAKVYDMVVPTSIGITLPKDIAAGVNSSDQKKAIDYIYGKISNNAIKVNAFDNLAAHKSEYIYFRSDHHWTALGAYYAYQKLMKAKGVEPYSLDCYTELQFPGFLGSFYRSTGKNPRFAANPDTVFAYVPIHTNTINVTAVDRNNQIYQKAYDIVRDGNAMNQSNKYLAFIAGDQPFGVITNPEAPENTVCTIVKESYGNCFVPFLVENYSTVYVIDYRYFPNVDARKLQDFVIETGTQDLIFLNNISATRNAGLVDALNKLIS